MNILFYTVANKRARDMESLALAFGRQGHRVFLLTQTPYSQLHVIFRQHGFVAAARVARLPWLPLRTFFQVTSLLWFCHRYRINIVHAHLDPCNLIAVLAQFFMRARVIVTRHHADALLFEASAGAQRDSRFIYRRARLIVAVSENAKRHMVNFEGVEERKITVIPVAFQFDLYQTPDADLVVRLRQKYDAALLLVSVARLSPLKRLDLVIQLLGRVAELGIDTRLLIVGKGPEEVALRTLAIRLGLEDRVVFIGFSHQVLPFLAAADVYVHLAVTEASNTAVKEAALVKTPVLVCAGVGDFDSYIVNGENGYCVDKANPLPQATMILKALAFDKKASQPLGARLHETVLKKFDIREVMPLYNQLHAQQ